MSVTMELLAVSQQTMQQCALNLKSNPYEMHRLTLPDLTLVVWPDNRLCLHVQLMSLNRP